MRHDSGARIGNYVAHGANVVMVKVIVSEFNKLEGNRYFDVESQTSFEVDHVTQVGESSVDERRGRC